MSAAAALARTVRSPALDHVPPLVPIRCEYASTKGPVIAAISFLTSAGYCRRESVISSATSGAVQLVMAPRGEEGTIKHVVRTIASFLLCLSSAFAQTVVSFVGEEVVVSRLEGGSVRRLPVRGEVQAVAANARYAYALVGGAEIVRVEIASGREASRLEVPC